MPGDVWREATLDELVEKVVVPVDVQPDENYRQLGIRSHGKGLFDKEPVTGADLGEKRVFWVEPDCLIINIVFAWEMAVARTTANDVGKIVSHRFPMFRPRQGIADLDFILYLFKTPYGKHLLNLASPGGAGRNKTLGQDNFLQSIIRVPPIAEQRKIVRILSTWDRAILAAERLVKNSNARQKALMQTIFGQHTTASVGRPEYRALGELAEIYDGTHTTPSYTEDGVPFYSVEQVTSGDFSSTKFISEDVFEEESRRVKIERGDVLMTRIGDIGTAKFVDWDARASFYVSLALIKCGPALNGEYLAHYIHTYAFQEELHKRTIHVAFPQKINLGEIGNCLVLLPSHEEQRRIATVLSLADRERSALQSQLDCLKRERTALMQQLLTRRSRVNVQEIAA